jgi:hypothetical protein
LGIITPTDELIFFRGVAQPPTSNIIVSIGLRENRQEKKHSWWEKTWFPVDFPLEASQYYILCTRVWVIYIYIPIMMSL